MPVSPWREALSGFDILAISLAVGVAAALLWLLPDAQTPDEWRSDSRRRLRLLLILTLTLLTLTSIATLIARSAAISGASLLDVGSVVPLVLTRTDFGRVWFARGIAVVLLWLVWLALKPANRQPRLYWLLLCLVAVVAFTRSATGHPGDHGDFAMPVWFDWLHLLAAGLWGGVVIAFIVAVRPRLLSAHALVTARFSSVAAVGLGLVAATGIYNAWHSLDGWGSLWTTRYGAILDIKVGLVILMALLGASNRFLYVPRVVRQDQSALRALRTLVALAACEALLMLAVVAVVALLINAMPPADM
ncbi:MAG TPA: CopD family protein [Gammaproteobacteria bacterium]|nr:CopD family protein [Gammaproteobacteria bacterium]